MPRFLTISPTHVSGKKEFAWNEFRDGGYIAIGWLENHNLTGKTIDQVLGVIRKENYQDEARVIDAFTKFLSLEEGDYVAVNNTNSGLFGVGKITSGYKYEKTKHNTGYEGADAEEGFYPHYRKVKWVSTSYVKREDLVGEGEKSWVPYGTVGSLEEELPVYIRRLLGVKLPKQSPKKEIVIPDYLMKIVESINHLKAKKSHQERAHESLVEDFFCALGYLKHVDIEFQKGRIDISLKEGDKLLAVVEVKKDWDLNSYNSSDAVMQGYRYALDQGARWVIVTNGDYYAIYDRLKGLSKTSNLVGEFILTHLTDEDEEIIQHLSKTKLVKPDVEEIFRHLSESFKKMQS
jgi:predicted Mrr-cat superfamily restriction endonuclease